MPSDFKFALASKTSLILFAVHEALVLSTKTVIGNIGYRDCLNSLSLVGSRSNSQLSTLPSLLSHWKCWQPLLGCWLVTFNPKGRPVPSHSQLQCVGRPRQRQ